MFNTQNSQETFEFTLGSRDVIAFVPKGGVRRALLISTGRHTEDGIDSLPGVDSDVDLVRERLLDVHCGFQDQDVVVLKTDALPTCQRIKKALKKFFRSCGANDFIFLYFAGHGFHDPKTNDDYYVPLDAEPIFEDERIVAFNTEKALSFKELREDIGACPAKFKWIVVDACRTNLARGDSDGKAWKPINKLEAAKGSLWFQSCGINQKSYEISIPINGAYVNHGLFTWYFCEGAKGKAARNGLVSPMGLFNYARDRMSEARRENNALPLQTPIFSCSEVSDGEFVFVDVSDGESVQAENASREALELFLKQEYERALSKIDEALRLAPENKNFQNLRNSIVDLLVKGHISRGSMFYADKKYSEALKEANDALRLDSTNVSALDLKKKAENPPKERPKTLPIDYLDSKGKQYRLIKAGSFMMGSPLTGEEVVAKYPTGGKVEWFNVAPLHKVTLTHDFYLARRPVTRGEFQRFVNATGYKTTAEKEGTARILTKEGGWDYVQGKSWRDPGFEQTNEHPVVCVSFDDALACIAWLNETASPDPELNGLKPLYRLPTEAEWEFACRAGTTGEFFWGDEEKDGRGYLNAAGTEKDSDGRGWSYHFSFDTGYPATSPVGSFKPNLWGLYDMLGNVWEWVSDWYGKYPTGTATDPKGADSGSWRVLRGGGWVGSPASCRCAYRSYGGPTRRYADLGFRVAFSLTTK